MYRLKAVALIALLIAALTGAVVVLSQDMNVLTPNAIETEHGRVQDVLKEKMIRAEESLIAQANSLSTDPILVRELDSLREKLLTTTPDDLRNNNNKWNKLVFDRLIDWKQECDSKIKQHKSSAAELLKAENGDIAAQYPVISWWGRSPDLILAFAAVPMKDGNTSALLIAQGLKSKELQRTGQRYDESLKVLAQIAQDQKQHFTHFIWEGKRYLAVVSPVISDNTLVGSTVIGLELSKELNLAFDSTLPDSITPVVVYASPKLGTSPRTVEDAPIIVTDDSDLKNKLESIRLRASSNVNDMSLVAVPFDQISPNKVHTGHLDDSRDLAVSRLRWLWNAEAAHDRSVSEETDIYFVSDLSKATQSKADFQKKVIIAAVVIFLIGIILAVLLVGAILGRLRRIKVAFGDAINSGEPIDTKALALLTDVDPDSLGQYVIKPLTSDNEENEDWNNLIMDFSDEANDKADANTSPEEASKLKEHVDVNEAKPLYEEYMRLRKENNINTPMDFDCFLRRLQRNAEKIKATYHCESVSFQVHVKDGNVLLKPKINKK